MKLHILTAAAALAVAGSVFAQTSTGTTPGATTTQPGQSSMGTGSAPSTPPTHPSERTAPSTTVPNTERGQTGTQPSSQTEAMQACMNLQSASERKDCMDKARADTGATSPSGTTSDSTTRTTPSGTTPATPATPATPGTSPATPATPATPGNTQTR
jgi:hypothetical protein